MLGSLRSCSGAVAYAADIPAVGIRDHVGQIGTGIFIAKMK
jgi:hypothetical protein